MKALVIGYGSIGKRHCEVLETLVQIDEICLVTSQDVAGKVCYKNLEEVSNLDKFDYFVIATPTFLHLENLKFIDERVSGKIIPIAVSIYQAGEVAIIEDAIVLAKKKVVASC